MKNYKKKPLIIQAIQYTGTNGVEVVQFIGDRWLAAKSTAPDGSVYGIQISTLEGTSYALSNNDYVIKGIHGEMYPCKPDIFRATYDEVPADEICNNCGKILLPFTIKKGLCEDCDK